MPKSPEELIDKDKYQVFLLACPANLPYSFVGHPWFVVNRRGIISRWEIFWMPKKWETSWGHLHKNFYSPFQGIPKFFFSERYLWRQVKLLGYIEGNENSLAVRMADFLEISSRVYPYCYQYSLIAQNSNTYVQWVLNHFPESGLKLPWNSFGRYAAPCTEPSAVRRESDLF